MEKHQNVRSTTGPEQQINQLIIFRVSDEEFGVPIEAVQEIIKTEVVTPIPDSPDFIKGLINVRGNIVAIIDVRARFFLPSNENTPSKHIVIIKTEGNLFGMMVDEVMEVLRIQEADIKSLPTLMTAVHEDYIRGVVTHENRLIILLNLAEVLSEKEIGKLFNSVHAHRRKIAEMNPGDNK